MADVQGNQPLSDWGNLMTSFGQGLANTNATNAGTVNTNANTGLVNQQAQGAALSNQSQAMQNQIMQARLPIILKALGDYRQQSDDSGEPDADGAEGGNGSRVRATPATDGQALPKDPTNPTAGSNGVPNQPAEDPTEDNLFDKNRIIGGLKQAYYVNPAGTAQEIAAIKNAAIADPDGKLGILEQAKQMRQLNVDNRVAAAQSKAGELYDAMDKGVLEAPPGRALDALDAVSPGIAEKIRKMLPDAADEDKAARKYAETVANEAHQYTGRKVTKGEDGIYRDETTGRALPGADRVGMSQEQMTNLAAKGAELVTVKNSDGSESQVPRWAQSGAPSLKAWVTKIADQNNVQAASPSVTGAPKAEFQSRLDTATKAAPQPGITPQQSAELRTAGPKAAAVQAQIAKDPALASALKDTDYDIKLPPVQANKSPSIDEAAQRQDIADSRKELYADSRQTAQAAAQSNQYLQAARDIIDNKGVTLGKYGALVAKASALGLKFDDNADASNYVEVAKYLTQAALQNAKQGFGKNFTEKEADTAINQMNASKDMPVDAVRAITDTAMRSNQYALDSAHRAIVYASTPNKDPRTFAEWNEAHFSRAPAVNGPKTDAGSVKITSAEDHAKLPKGAHYIDPSGKERVKQ